MAVRKIKIFILLCGVLISAATTPCHAQEPGKLFDVKVPQQAEVSPAFVPDAATTPVSRTPQTKPDKDVSGKSWYWRFMEGIITSAAKFNTEKQDDGRPQPIGNSR